VLGLTCYKSNALCNNITFISIMQYIFITSNITSTRKYVLLSNEMM